MRLAWTSTWPATSAKTDRDLAEVAKCRGNRGELPQPGGGVRGSTRVTESYPLCALRHNSVAGQCDPSAGLTKLGIERLY